MLALFVSDLHLDSALPATTARFLQFLRETAAGARQLYLLGDIFEYWAGDDDLDSGFNQSILRELRTLRDLGTALYWIAGNRDFLVGDRFAEAAGLVRLPDPATLTLAGHSLVISHGDALCTDDTAYLAFRSQVRDPAWQQQFLAQPLAQRKKVIEGLRQQSREAQRAKTPDIMDVNESAVLTLFDATGASLLIHGHTHRPAVHDHGKGRTRYVLPDWDLDHDTRGGWLQMNESGNLTVIDFRSETGSPARPAN